MTIVDNGAVREWTILSPAPSQFPIKKKKKLKFSKVDQKVHTLKEHV